MERQVRAGKSSEMCPGTSFADWSSRGVGAGRHLLFHEEVRSTARDSDSFGFAVCVVGFFYLFF